MVPPSDPSSQIWFSSASHAAAPPESVGDETVLLLVLAAASEREGKAWAVWSQELRRRFRDPEVEKWLLTLQK